MLFGKKKKQLELAKMPRKLVASTEGNSFISEQFRTVRANINFTIPNKELKTLIITSSMPGEGKSTIGANMAVVFAQEGKKVLLVDADLRKPTLHFTYDVPNQRGLSHILIGEDLYYDAIHETSIAGLSVLPSGPIPPNPTELLISKNMDTFLEDVKEKYDLIIFDAPPLISVSDSQILGNKCDATVLVVNTGVSKKEEFLKSQEMLVASKAKIIGVVLNNYKMPRNYYQNYYTYSN